MERVEKFGYVYIVDQNGFIEQTNDPEVMKKLIYGNVHISEVKAA